MDNAGRVSVWAGVGWNAASIQRERTILKLGVQYGRGGPLNFIEAGHNDIIGAGHQPNIGHPSHGRHVIFIVVTGVG